MVDAYLELYLHFRERPEDLDALLADGDAVPDVSIWEDTHSSLSKVIRTIIAGIWVAFFQECQQ